jgi:hypothetical protein
VTHDNRGAVEVTVDLVVMINLLVEVDQRRLATPHLAAPFAFDSSIRHLSDENLIQDAAHQGIAVHHQILVSIYLPARPPLDPLRMGMRIDVGECLPTNPGDSARAVTP